MSNGILSVDSVRAQPFKAFPKSNTANPEIPVVYQISPAFQRIYTSRDFLPSVQPIISQRSNELLYVKNSTWNLSWFSSRKLPSLFPQQRQILYKDSCNGMGGAQSGCCGARRTWSAEVSVLDRVISGSSDEDNCLLYRLANYKNGGELIDAYNIGGQAECEKLIMTQFGVFMYAQGKGQLINRAEYLRWKFRDHKQVVLPIEASLSAHDPLGVWSDHEACWQMQYRGSLGETLLHVLIICDTKVHTRLARTLLKCFPKLALDVVEGEEYLGASALHLAIAYSNNELVQDLVEAGAKVNQKATGSFFLPRDQQRPKPAKYSDYEGLAYLGEYPLAWAACCSNESVYNLLLDNGADPDLQDRYGNMILHMVVICDKLDMFGYALRHPRLPARNGMVNISGLTPLTLACKLGRAEVFREMLEISAREFWRYSNITCSAYPLNALDTLLPDGRTNWNSALFIILNGTKEEHLDMLDGGIIQKLLEEKWKTFVQRQFLKRLAILFIHLVMLSMAIYLRPDDHDDPLIGGTSTQDIMRYCFELGTIGGVLHYLIFQQGEEIKNQGLISFLKQLSHDPAKSIFLASNFLILSCIPFRLLKDTITEEAILGFAVPGSWFLLMFFAGAIRLTGPFITMVYSMITGDMLTFGIIYIIVLFGFSQSFYFLYKGFPGVKTSLYNSYHSTWMALFQITLGDYNYADLSNTSYPTLSKTVFCIFMVLVPILLLNMLIAMMGNTYSQVIERSEKEWMKQWAKIVVTLERAIKKEDAHHYLQEYSIKLDAGTDPSTEQRGVMIIKSKSKTRAKQRKGAVANWKKVGKYTINELRKRGISGEQLRRLIWERSSITTPIKIPKACQELLYDDDDTDMDQPPPNPGGGILNALDVIAFTNNLDLNIGGGGGGGVANGYVPSAPVATRPSAPPAEKTPSALATLQTNAPLYDNSVIDKVAAFAEPPPYSSLNETPGSLPTSLFASAFGADPLRQLVLAVDAQDDKALDPLRLRQLAEMAVREAETNEPVPPKEQHRYCCPAKVAALEATNGDLIKEETNPSDSDDLGTNGPLLGRGSRIRRAKSARLRKAAQSDVGGVRPATSGGAAWDRARVATLLFSHRGSDEEEESSSEDVLYGVINRAFLRSPPPSQDSDPDLPRIEDFVERELAAKQKVDEHVDLNKHSKKKSKARPKTAKPNRVAPMKDEPQRRSGSAVTKSSTKTTNDMQSSPPPDPLEPWSTQGIANMNTLLSMDKAEDSL